MICKTFVYSKYFSRSNFKKYLSNTLIPESHLSCFGASSHGNTFVATGISAFSAFRVSENPNGTLLKEGHFECTDGLHADFTLIFCEESAH